MFHLLVLNSLVKLFVRNQFTVSICKQLLCSIKVMYVYINSHVDKFPVFITMHTVIPCSIQLNVFFQQILRITVSVLTKFLQITVHIHVLQVNILETLITNRLLLKDTLLPRNKAYSHKLKHAKTKNFLPLLLFTFPLTPPPPSSVTLSYVGECKGPHNIYKLYRTSVLVKQSSKSICPIFTVGQKVMIPFRVKEKVILSYKYYHRHARIKDVLDLLKKVPEHTKNVIAPYFQV